MSIKTRCKLPYSLVVNDADGGVQRGGAYQQDILLYDEIDDGEKRLTPRVSIELKA